MGALHFNSRGGEWIGDMPAWLIENAEDNGENVAHIKNALAFAIAHDLTPRQREMIELYYGHGMNMPQIAAQLDINRSTVSRTICRAERRLVEYLKYTSPTLLRGSLDDGRAGNR